jgi:hypothetical protein
MDINIRKYHEEKETFSMWLQAYLVPLTGWQGAFGICKRGQGALGMI